MRRLLTVVICMAACGVPVEAPSVPPDLRSALPDGGWAGADTEAGDPIDPGGAPVRCSANEDCWFGAVCYQSLCVDPLFVTGAFERRPITNAWHRVTVSLQRGELLWSNEAGVSWDLEFRDGELWTRDDCPYGAQALGLDGDGSQVDGLIFQGELYQRID